jgi:hypothetical protein
MLKRLSQGWQVQNLPCSYTCFEILGFVASLGMLEWQTRDSVLFPLALILTNKGANS